MFEDLFNESEASGFNAMNFGQAEDLVKTFTVGHSNGVAAPGSLTGGPALMMESVDGNLKSTTLTRRDLVFWPSVPQDRAYSTSEQYLRTNSYGDNGSPYVPESGSPAIQESNFDRRSQPVVFFSTRRGVSIVSNFVRYHGNQNPEAIATQDGMMWILEKMERELYKGLADFSNAGAFDGSIGAIPGKLQSLNLRGYELQLRQGDTDYTAQIQALDGYGGDTSLIKSLGDSIDEIAIEDLATARAEDSGHANCLDWSPKTMSDFVRAFFPKERVNSLGIQDGKAGYVVRMLSTTAGDVMLRPNVFLKPKLSPKANPDRSGLVPSAPADLVNNAAASVKTGSGNTMDQASGTTTFAKNDVYVYTVTACNEQGESNQAIQSVAITISTAANQVTFKISDPSSGPVPTHYAVYRTDADGATTAASGGKSVPCFIGYVARTGTTTLFTDLNKKLPGAATAYLMDVRPETTMWRQLAPMLRLSQGQLGTAREFLLWLAGTLLVFAPRKSGIFENVTRSAA
jgi:hypothetical protein